MKPRDGTRDVYLVLGLFMRAQGDDGGLSWSAELVAKEARIELHRAISAIAKLVRIGYIACLAGGLYRLTLEGKEAYERVRRRSVTMDYQQWVNAAREGMDPDGSQTTIDRAAVPKERAKGTLDREVALGPLEKHDMATTISDELGISYQEAFDGLHRGEFFQCPGFGREFHVARQNSRHSLCAACSKRKWRVEKKEAWVKTNGERGF